MINGIFIGLFWCILFVVFVKCGNGNGDLCVFYVGGGLIIITNNNTNTNTTATTNTTTARAHHNAVFEFGVFYCGIEFGFGDFGGDSMITTQNIKLQNTKYKIKSLNMELEIYFMYLVFIGGYDCYSFKFWWYCDI